MTLLSKIENKTAVVGIIGLGYVGLPLALEFAKKEFRVIGFDLDERKSKFIRTQATFKFENRDEIFRIYLHRFVEIVGRFNDQHFVSREKFDFTLFV